MKKFIYYFSMLVILAACASKTTAPTPPPPTNVGTIGGNEGEPTIDYVGLQRSLSLDRGPDQLGYAEKNFDTCSVGYGYSPTHNCRRQYFVVVNFRLSCRDSEGTVSYGLSESDMAPIAGKEVRWNLKGLSGVTSTDGSGNGQIRTVSTFSQKRERLRLAVGSEFLYMRAQEITRVVTPHSWCSSENR